MNHYINGTLQVREKIQGDWKDPEWFLCVHMSSLQLVLLWNDYTVCSLPTGKAQMMTDDENIVSHYIRGHAYVIGEEILWHITLKSMYKL